MDIYEWDMTEKVIMSYTWLQLLSQYSYMVIEVQNSLLKASDILNPF